MTCLRARQVWLRVVRGYAHDQYPSLVIPETWTREQVLEHARAVHGPLGHTVDVFSWSDGAYLWLADPAGFTDYTTGKQA